ncbi:hypothetical protein ACOMHN_032765 [Nucella lapillus]
MGNSKEDKVRVSIDHTPPEVRVQGLRGRWGREGLQVHGSTDLSTMTLALRASDPHSGLRTLGWTLSTQPLGGDDVGSGTVAVQRLDNTTSCGGQENCYCPSVDGAVCETDRYLLTFPGLLTSHTHQGDHHRRYYLTLTLTNNAQLTAKATARILLDESPPTVGVVWEGLAGDGRAEMDFTSRPLVHVRWHGYGDPESGVALYRVVMAGRCLTRGEVDGANVTRDDNATEVTHGVSSATFTLPAEGRYFFSVVAYNGALEPSGVACSDGVTYDTTPPSLRNVTIAHARSGRMMIGCTQQPHQAAWLVGENLTRVALYSNNSSACRGVCSGPSPALDVLHLLVSSPHVLGLAESEQHCRTLPKMSKDSALVLPSDYVHIAWQGHDEESQMEEYYIGLGGDLATSSAPDILPFTPTHAHTAYHAGHLGLGQGDQFFVFLRVLSKAGLNGSVTLGPVVIDVTAPTVTQPLTTRVEGGRMVVTWQPGVFVDPEQPPGVGLNVSFRVGHGESFVTPFRAVSDSNVSSCRSAQAAGCVHYPVTDLTPYDTGDSRPFFFQVHIVNAAGHVTSVNSSSVRLPASHPPGHAVVLDVLRVRKESEGERSAAQPNTTASRAGGYSDDVDAIVLSDEVCVAWTGFHHKEKVRVEVGVGTARNHDDVIKLHSVDSQSPVCLNITSVPVNTQLFSVVRATSSGGGVSSVFSSDGFVVVSKTESANSIKVFNGNGCHENNIIGKVMITPSSTAVSVSENARIPVHAGDFLFIELSPFVPQVVFTNAVLRQTTFTGYQLVAETPNVTALFPQPVAANTSLQIQRCQKDSSVLHPFNTQFTVTWQMAGPGTQYVKYFKTEIMDTTCFKTAKDTEKLLTQKCTLHEERTLAVQREVTVVYGENLDNAFQLDHLYVSSVTPCFDDACLQAGRSQPVIYGAINVGVQFQRGNIENADHQRITVDVQASAASLPEAWRSKACGYLWTVSADRSGSLALSDWLLQTSGSCSTIKIAQQVPMRGKGRGTLYVCLRLLFPVESHHADCFQLSRSPNTNAHEPFQVIELSREALYQTDFRPFLFSQQLGSKLHDLDDLDLDFASSRVRLSAILTNSRDLKVTWFLMTSPRAPKSRGCAGNEECVTSEEGKGQVSFSPHRSKLQGGHIYYACASWTGDSDRGASTQIDQYVCGDGVVIDDVPPVKGSVAIGNADSGYLAGSSHVMVTWSGFSDVETDIAILGDSVTLNYSVALGSYPGAEDLVGFVPVGQRTSWTSNHLVLPSGATCIATVRAQDRVGHVTEVSSNQVIVDSTPPVIGNVAAGTITAVDFAPGHELPAHWEGVEDKESGLHRVEVGVAPAGGGDNVIEFKPCHGTSVILTDTSGLTDGHAYVVLLKATNKAGLTTVQSSAPFVVDSSPPSPGHVWHTGSNTTITGGYSTEVGVYGVRWRGYLDPHSGLDYYRVGLGSSPGQTDVVPFVYVGRQTSYTWREQLDQGTRYYAALQACNRARLCRVTSSSSLIFDDSPPTSGLVTVGLYGGHDKFLGHNSSLPAQWRGFSDPQTGIQHFRWCVGRTPGACDVVPSSHTLLSRAVHQGGVTLPLATPLYVSVTAVNPAGLAAVSVSDSFVVDPTPPEVKVKPQFLSRDGSPVSSQWDRSILRMAWLFDDPESSVVSHTVYIRSQLTGRLVCDPIILGPDTQMTLPLRQSSLLTDGDRHWASVSACNAAHLCVIAASDVILLIDSTPPVTGMFRSPLGWKREGPAGNATKVTVIDVMWGGFSDAESDVTWYELIVGRSYNGGELSGGRIRAGHNSSTSTRQQQYRLQIGEELQAGDVLHLAVLAENGLGLRSPLIRTAFVTLRSNREGSSGSLELMRHSCNASYCTRECTCAAAGKVCSSRGSLAPCTQLSAEDGNLSSFRVVPHLGSSEAAGSSRSTPIPHVFTPVVTGGSLYLTSTKCLEGHWTLAQPQSLLNVSRFEYSFSLANMSAGQGVFDPRTEPVWYDVGRRLEVVRCLPGNVTLSSGQSYVLHVRVWPSRDSHVTFVSAPAVVDHSAPSVRRGRAVLDSADRSCSRDVDCVTAERSEVTACWTGVFADAQSGVVGYQIWVGTSPRASNHLTPTNLGLNTTWTLPTKPLEPGTRYYVTVRAWSGAGLQTTAASDGFLVDVTSPVPGVVFPSRRYGNRHAQSSTSALWASWHGFEDGGSGVKFYQAAVIDAGSGSVSASFLNVGFKTEVQLGGLALVHGHRYKVAVKATDAAGLESPAVESAAILVDVTPPEGVTCTGFQSTKNVTLTPSLTAYHLRDDYGADVTLHMTQPGEMIKVEVTASGVDPSVLGELHVAELRMPLSFHLSAAAAAAAAAASGVYTARHTFLSPYSGEVRLRVQVEGPPNASLEARFSRCLKTQASSQGAVTVRQTSAYAVSVCSQVRDSESGIQTLMVGVGTTPGGLQLRSWTRVGGHHSGHLSLVDLRVQQATTVYAVVVAQNRAGLWSRFLSSAVLMDKTGPALSEVRLTLRYEGEGRGKVTEEVWAEGRWSAQDAESGVEVCACSFAGQQTNQTRSTTLSPAAGDVTKGQCQGQLRDPRHGSQVTMTVTCYNTVQLSTTVTSRAVRVLLRPPVMTEVSLASLPNSMLTSPYDRFSAPQVRSSNSSLQFVWRGIQDPTVRQFYFRFLSNSVLPSTPWFLLDSYKTTALLERAKDKNGKRDVIAQLMAVNERNMTSQVVSLTVRLDDSRPLLTGKRATSSFNKGKGQLSVDWRHVFDVTRDVTFSLFAGTGRGYGDVINHVTTKQTHYTGHYADDMTTTSMYVNIHAVYDNGLVSEYSDTLDLS